MSLLDWLKPRKLAASRRSSTADPSAKLIRDLVAGKTPMSLATIKAASDAATGAKTAERAALTEKLPPISRCSIASFGVTPVY